MRRHTQLGLTLVVTVAMLLAVPSALAGGPGAVTAQDDTEEDEEEISPGERLSGVVAAQQAELDGEMDERTFGVQVANARTDNETADVVGEKLKEVEQRIDELDQRLEELEAEREAGNITQGQYAAKAAATEAERASLERVVDKANETASGLPAEKLAEKGINVSAIQTLKNRASNMSGPEVAAVARSIAGNTVGQGIDRGNAPDDIPGNGTRGPPQDAGNDTAGNGSAGPDDKGPGAGQNGAAGEDDEETNTSNGSETENPDSDGSDRNAGT
jgi:hypothetical protein